MRKYLCKEAGHSQHSKPSVLDLLELESLHENIQVSSLEGSFLALKSSAIHDTCPGSHRKGIDFVSCEYGRPQAHTLLCTACYPDIPEGRINTLQVVG